MAPSPPARPDEPLFDELDALAVQTLRCLSIDMVQAANSGHPGAPLGCAPLVWVLFSRHLCHDPAAPAWPNRDRFVLSAGHASALLYSTLHLFGYDLGLDELRQFRQLGSRTPGHPENTLTPGIETTTGPLGQGLATAVGMAVAESHLAAVCGETGLVDHATYVLASDGDLMEGLASEAASLAGHWGLGKLVVLYDDNRITIDGETDLAFTEDVLGRFASYGWHVQRVADGNDLVALDGALGRARDVVDRPSLIAVRTVIGYGSPNKQGRAAAHGAPLGWDEVHRTKRALGWPYEEPFVVPPEARRRAEDMAARGRGARAAWEERLAGWSLRDEAAAEAFRRRLEGRLPDDWAAGLPRFEPDQKGLATRKASHAVLAALVEGLPELIGGSADLTESNGVHLPAAGTYGRDNRAGRLLHFGVREHAMGAICNGMALHGGLLPFGATFLVFSDYMRGAVRVGALAEAHVVWVWTHDSIGLGEDGPTHQPVEHLAALRAMPDLLVIRPSDANEVRVAWEVAIEEHRPCGLILTRQSVPILDRTDLASAEGLRRGGYILAEPPPGLACHILLLSTGSEVALTLDVRQLLGQRGVGARVVALPCWELFAEQPDEYKEEVLSPGTAGRVAIEAASSFGWERFVGLDGLIIGLDSFGASAPAKALFSRFGFTAQAIVERIIQRFHLSTT